MNRGIPSLKSPFLLLLPTLICVTSSAWAGAITSITDPTTNWNVIPVVSLDPANDQQTGQGDADLVGIVADPDFYSNFDGTNVYYRIRLGAVNKSGYSGLLWIGLDANNDGALDLFIGIDNQGSTSNIGFFAPGTGLNNSPSTTSIANAVPQYQIAETATNYNYQAVSSTLDPTITNTDLNADGNVDAFLSFRVPYFGASGTATLQGAMKGIANIAITGSSTFAYVLATSTQANSLNQDIGGIPKNYNSASTYTQLGAISPQLGTNGTVPVTVTPEPATTAQLLLALAILVPTAARRLKKTRA